MCVCACVGEEETASKSIVEKDFLTTVSTENAPLQKFDTKQNSESSAQIQIGPKCLIEFVPRDTMSSECLSILFCWISEGVWGGYD